MPSASDVPPVDQDRLDALGSADEPLLVEMRRELHAHPELSGQEVETTAWLGGHLRDLGLTPVRLSTGTGLVCDIALGERAKGERDEDAAPTPVVALRADIDALAMNDDKDVSYRSRVAGVTHACGHDVHTTVVLGAARALVALRDEAGVSGTVRLVFEPAEESVPGGAVDVISDGYLSGVRAIFGLHCDPKLDVGQVGCKSDELTSAADWVEVALSGPGGHTARPELTADIVDLLSRLVRELQPAIDRRTDEVGQLQVVFGAVHAGDAANVIPTQGMLRGTLRTRSHDSWLEAPKVFEEAVAEVLEGAAVTVSVQHRRGVPPVVNDEAMTDLLADAARAALGPQAVRPTVQSMGGDSFAWYLEEVPGSYARLGTHDPAGGAPRLDLHAGTFDVDERAIGVGVRVLVTAALAALQAQWGTSSRL